MPLPKTDTPQEPERPGQAASVAARFDAWCQWRAPDPATEAALIRAMYELAGCRSADAFLELMGPVLNRETRRLVRAALGQLPGSAYEQWSDDALDTALETGDLTLGQRRKIFRERARRKGLQFCHRCGQAQDPGEFYKGQARCRTCLRELRSGRF